MDSGSRKLREVENLPLTDTIISIAASNERFAVGCLDDSIYLWNNEFSPFPNEPSHTWTNAVTGLVDLKFSNDGKKLASCSMDSVIKVWEIEINETIVIDVPVMSAWKLTFVEDNLVTCGDLGQIEYYDLNTKESIKKLEGGDVFSSAIASSNGNRMLATGNNNGDLFVMNLEEKSKNKKDKLVSFKTHNKMIRSISFSEDVSKIMTGSDDQTLKIFDIVSEKVVSSYDSHKEAVSCVQAHPTDNKIAFSCSFDKSLKIWDLRMKGCLDTFQSGSALWALSCIGRNLVAGGENGVLSIFSIE